MAAANFRASYPTFEADFERALGTKNIVGINKALTTAYNSGLFSNKPIIHRIAYMIDGLRALIQIAGVKITLADVEITLATYDDTTPIDDFNFHLPPPPESLVPELSAILTDDDDVNAESRRSHNTPAEMAHIIGARFNSHRNLPTAVAFQLYLYKLFFNSIHHYYLLKPTGEEGAIDQDAPDDLLESMFVRLQKLLRNFCVDIVGDKFREFPTRPTSKSECPAGGTHLQLCRCDRTTPYKKYMRDTYHYTHVLKMLILIANKLKISGSFESAHRYQLRNVIYFLGRSMLIKLFDDDVNNIVEFIFQLLGAFGTINRIDASRSIDIGPLFDVVEPMLHTMFMGRTHTFSAVFVNYPENIYVWLQQLLLARQSEIISNEEGLTAAWRKWARPESNPKWRRIGSRTPDKGGSNKKKGHPKKSKRSGRNEQLKTNKKSKSRRNNKYKNT